MRRDWIVHDYKTGDILTRASSVWVMMNKETRRLSKIPDEVRVEIGPYFVDSPPVLDEDSRKLPKLNESTADYICIGLTPKRSDLDVNLHVNNVKYIGWIVELIMWVKQVLVGIVSSVFLLVASPVFGLVGIWAGLFLFMTLRVAARIWRLGMKSGPWKLVWPEIEQENA
ncbi:hypothetical protein ACSBR1_013372 [Camellia fascicularis]